MSLGNKIIFVENVKAKPSSDRRRPPGFLRISPVDAGQKITELGRGDRHHAVSRARPQEAAPFQPLRKQARSLTIVPDHLQQVASAPPKAEQMTAQRIATQYLLHLQGEWRKALPHVGVARRKPYPHAARKRNHGSVSSPRMIRPSVSTSSAIDNKAQAVRAHDLDPADARIRPLLRPLRHDRRRHGPGKAPSRPSRYALRHANRS